MRPMTPMITRCQYEGNTIQQDGITMDSRRARVTHELNTKMNLREVIGRFFDMTKMFGPLPMLLPNPEKLPR